MELALYYIRLKQGDGLLKMWSTLKNLKKFTPKAEVDRIIGMPIVPLEDRPAYYYGRGIVIYYSPTRFKVTGIQRVEYGDPGEYAVGLFHFSTAAVLKTELGLSSFEADDIAPFNEDIAYGVISYRSTFREIHQWAVKNTPEDYHEGITQRLVDGKMTFFRRFILYGPYELYFYGRSKLTKVEGFQFVFPE